MTNTTNERKTMDERNEIYYWAHMLDESVHESYYEVYMRQHPEDKLPVLIDTLIGEFAADMKKDNVDFYSLIKNDDLDFKLLDELCDNMKHRYVWDRIKAQTYAAIISRFVALTHNAQGQRFNESDFMTYGDVSHGVSRRVIEQCLDIICHNTNVLEANNNIRLMPVGDFPTNVNCKYPDIVAKAFEKHGIPLLARKDPGTKNVIEDYLGPIILYKAWGSYAKGRMEKYVSDSDNGPEALKKVLNSCEYGADYVDLVVMLNRALDVVHLRCDLAAAFIEGGQNTCAMVSNLPDQFVV